MKRSFVLSSLFLAVAATACGSNRVVVEAAIDSQTEDQQVQVLADLPIRLLPYDRDAIFDSLETAYTEPEPAIPADLLAQRDEIMQAESDWRQSEDRWSEARDSALALSRELERMTQQGLRATPQYQQQFRQFERLDADARQAQQRSQTAFARYEGLQSTFLSRADSIRVVREQWADRAYADFDRVINDRLRASGREEYADTTDASGAVVFRGVPQGQWWVYARYTQLFDELYWNFPVQVSGDSTGVVLNRQNAESRPVM